MQIIRLEQDRIKVVLTSDDLTDMNINWDSLSPRSPELNVFLCGIIDAVKAETGFSTERGQMIIEALKDGDGIILLLSVSKKSAYKIRGIRAVKKSDNIVFEFPCFDDLAGMLVNIDHEYLINMNLYMYNDSFFIAVPRQSIPVLIYEYSLKNRKSHIAESILSEYGKLLAGGYALTNMVLDLKKLN